MPAVLLGGRMTVAAIGLLELLALLPPPRARGRRGLERPALLVIVPAAGAFLPPQLEARAAYLILLLWAGGLQAARALRAAGEPACRESGRRLLLWHAAAGGSVVVLGLLRLILASVLLPLLLLFLFLAGLLAIIASSWLLRSLRSRAAAPLLLHCLCFSLLAAAHLWETLAAAAVAPPAQVVVPATLLCLGALFVLTAREGRSSVAFGLGASTPAAAAEQEQRLRRAYSRIAQTEHSLLVQDRLVAAGVLAAGAAHEFKNILGCIRATVDHGLRGAAGTQSERCLQLVREHAVQAQRVVTELLEALVRHGRERPERFLLLRGLSSLLDIVRAAFRPETIRFKVEIPEALEVRTRRGELEQVLLSLIRNAADSVRRQQGGAGGAGQIALRARRLEEAVVIDVIDSGGGVSPDIEQRLFEPAVSDKDSTGVGLYLAGTLAERNGGSLRYFPVQGGSCFRLTLPPA